MQDFKHIRAWQRAHALSIALHKLVDTFSGHAHLKSQLTRAVDSIASNIVEGCGADTNKEFARFLDVSIKSANETEYRLLMARDLDLIARRCWQRHSNETVEIRKMIYAYRKKLLRSPRRPDDPPDDPPDEAPSDAAGDVPSDVPEDASDDAPDDRSQ